MVHWHEYKSIVYELLKLEMSDYTVDRDTPFSVTGKLPQEYKSIVYELLKLEMSDYTVDRDTPFSVTGKLPHAKICLRILQDRDDQVDLGI